MGKQTTYAAIDRTLCHGERGHEVMTENEMKLIKIVREHNQPIQALMVAIHIIVSYLRQHGSYPRPFLADPREQV